MRLASFPDLCSIRKTTSSLVAGFAYIVAISFSLEVFNLCSNCLALIVMLVMYFTWVSNCMKYVCMVGGARVGSLMYAFLRYITWM